VKGKVKGLALV